MQFLIRLIIEDRRAMIGFVSLGLVFALAFFGYSLFQYNALADGGAGMTATELAAAKDNWALGMLLGGLVFCCSLVIVPLAPIARRQMYQGSAEEVESP